VERLLCIPPALVEGLLAARRLVVALSLASRGGLAALVVRASTPFVGPFRILPLQAHRYIGPEITILIAMVVYLGMGLALIGLLRMIRPPASG
jgi:hypothetical protein